MVTRKTLSDIGESEAIKQLCSSFSQNDTVICGPGDDCAVVRNTNCTDTDLLFTSDPLIQNIHFSTGLPADSIGRKAIGRALSDIAAMGGIPAWVLANIAAPPSTELEIIIGIGNGIASLADKFSAAIVGGDLSEAEILTINVFAAGTVPAGKAVLRSTASPGDRIYVTGSLGGSITGKHLAFVPRIAEGLMLREWATSMIDISDGLATDLKHISDMSDVGAVLTEKDIPISQAALNMSDGVPGLTHALCDGEDFELLFTVSHDRCKEFERSWRNNFELTCTCIGNITDRSGILEIKDEHGNNFPLIHKGFQHFETEKA